MLEPATERRALALFERLLDVPEPERDEWIRDHSGGDRALRDRLQAMRGADRIASLRTGGAADTLEEERPPERVGAYRLGERIGRGGMGSVYRAERVAGGFNHVAAIKLIKPGLLSEALVERFGRERQTLARLTHPNIAQLFDGGETEEGSPFIIMELVDGLPLLEWAEERAPSRAERQRLFGDICRAVAFAHRNLIVHRDLTPSNILVTPEGVAKLIDFGIARPVDPGLDGEGETTLGSLSLTPGYAAPERMISAEVTTAADIYSLGKLLEKLMRPERGDPELKAIVACATAERPQDRYSTAEALAADVDAWGGGRPVTAMRGGRRYHVRKFVARHRPQVALAALTLLLLLSALVVTGLALSRAQAARTAEATRFSELRSLASYMLFDLNGQLERVAGNSAARLGLADRAQRYLSALASSADAAPDLRLESARGFVALAQIQGVPGEPNLNQRERARANLIRATSMLRAADLPVAEAKPLLAEALIAMTWIQAHGDVETKAAQASLAGARAALQAVPVPARGERWWAARGKMNRMALELTLLDGKGPELLRLANLMERDIEQWPGPMRTAPSAALTRAYAAHYRGISHYLTDRLGDGVDQFLIAQAGFQDLARAQPNDPTLLYMIAFNGYTGFGAASGLEARQAQAADFLRTARRTIDRLTAIDPQDHAVRDFAGTIRGSEAQALSDVGRHREALALQQDVVATRRAALGAERKASALNRLILAEITLGNIAQRGGDRALSCASYQAASRGLAELTAQKAPLGFVANYAPGLRSNTQLCADGAPTAKLRILDGS